MEYKSSVDVTIPEDISIADYVLTQASLYGDRKAWIDDATGKSWTYAEFVEKCKRVGTALSRQGLKKGDVLTVYSPNCMEYVPLMYGTILCGGVIMGMTPTQTHYELKKRFLDANTRFVVTRAAYYNLVKTVCDECPNVKEIFTIRESVNGCLTFSDLESSDIDLPSVTINPRDDTAILNYSSGTTGYPKGILFTHYNWISQIQQTLHPSVTVYTRDGKDINPVSRPFFHAYGQIYHITVGVYAGATQVFPADNSNEALLDVVQRYKTTFLPLTPLQMNSLVKCPQVTEYDTSSVHSVLSAACPLADTVYHSFQKHFPAADIRDFHGMSEIMGALFRQRGERQTGVGRPVANSMAKIVDIDTEKTLGPNQRGELWFKGPTVFKGYKDPEFNKSAFEDGWFKTGDIAYFDNDGNCFVVDRLKDLIKCELERIAPAELEDVIHKHPGVFEVAVVAKADPDKNEVPVAFVVPKPGALVTEYEVQECVQACFSRPSWLHGGVIFRESLPKAPSGKILRRILREELQTDSLCNNAHINCHSLDTPHFEDLTLSTP